MVVRNELGSWAIVTAITVIIWLWAAGETREERSIDIPTLRFQMVEPGDWLIRPDSANVSVQVEGSRMALERAETLLRKPFFIGLRNEPGNVNVSLLSELRRHEELRETGVSIIAVDPSSENLEIDAMVRQPARIRPSRPGLIEIIELEPPEVEIRMPQSVHEDWGSLPMSVVLDPSMHEGAEPGIRQTKTVEVRLPENLLGEPDVSVLPSRVNVTFTVQSAMTTHVLDSVRLQVAGPHEDWDEYTVDLSPKQLRRVEISANVDLIRRVESGEAQVFAVLHLSSAEKESLLERKAISYFIAMHSDGPVRLDVTSVDGSPDLPLIDLTITRKEAPPS